MAFDELSRTKGYEFLRKYITEQTTNFSFDVLYGKISNLEELNYRRGLVVGMNMVISKVEEDLEAVRAASTVASK